MSVEEFSLNDNSGKFDVSGIKRAYILCYESTTLPETNPDPADVGLVWETLKDLGFEIANGGRVSEGDEEDSEDAEEFTDPESDQEDEQDGERLVVEKVPSVCYNDFIIRNLSPKSLLNFIDNIADKNSDSKCVAIYLSAPQIGFDLMTSEGKTIPLLTILKRLRKLQCPKLLFLQANVGEDAGMRSVLLNTEDDKDDGDTFTLPESANILLAYLPNCKKQVKSVPEVLREELLKPFDINVVMTTVIHRLTSMDTKPIPKFGSTLTKLLYLKQGPDELCVKEVPAYACRRRRCLAYVYLFGQYEDDSIGDLISFLKPDRENLTSAFSELGFETEFPVKEGKMTVVEFYKSMYQILRDRSKMAECDCLAFVISSHGKRRGLVQAYNGCLSLDAILQALSTCEELEGKPKLILTDSCRGNSLDFPVLHKVTDSEGLSKAVVPKDKKDLIRNDSCDITDTLVVRSCTEGKRSYCDSDGSAFVSELCKQVRSLDGRRKSFLSLLNSTIHDVAHLSFHDTDEGTQSFTSAKQQVTFTSTLRKSLILAGEESGTTPTS